MLKFDCLVFVFKTKGKQKPKDMEADILDLFYSKFHSLPIGNGAFSFRKTN